MRKLLNTLYVMTRDCYLTLDGENIVILLEDKTLGRFPLHTLENIVCFTYKGASPALMGACAERLVGMTFYTPNGKFLARTVGKEYGNVLLRKEQYRISDKKEESLQFAKNMIIGKIFNGRWSIERTIRDHAYRIDKEKLKQTSNYLQGVLSEKVKQVSSLDELRGVEGNAAVSFAYTILAGECANALYSVGLDPYVGFMHADRPGRKSLALDMMEELRPIMADRMILTLINTKALQKNHFECQSDGAVLLNEDGRKVFFNAWQTHKKEMITHPFLKEKIEWGLVPYVQALLLARTIRGDLDEYPPFMWK